MFLVAIFFLFFFQKTVEANQYYVIDFVTSTRYNFSRFNDALFATWGLPNTNNNLYVTNNSIIFDNETVSVISQNVNVIGSVDQFGSFGYWNIFTTNNNNPIFITNGTVVATFVNIQFIFNSTLFSVQGISVLNITNSQLWFGENGIIIQGSGSFIGFGVDFQDLGNIIIYRTGNLACTYCRFFRPRTSAVSTITGTFPPVQITASTIIDFNYYIVVQPLLGGGTTPFILPASWYRINRNYVTKTPTECDTTLSPTPSFTPNPILGGGGGGGNGSSSTSSTEQTWRIVFFVLIVLTLVVMVTIAVKSSTENSATTVIVEASS